MQVLFTFLLSLGLLAGLLLVLRKPVRWYLGIDAHLQNQQKIIALLTDRAACTATGETDRTDNRPKPEKSGRYRRRRRSSQQCQTADDTVHA